MDYLGAEYKLSQISEEEYLRTVQSVALSKRFKSVVDVVRGALIHEDPALAEVVSGYAHLLHEAYGDGGGMYMLTMAASLKALRSRNRDVAPISEGEWHKATEREFELRGRPSVGTVEMVSGLGLAEVRSVNAGYTDGYEICFQRPGFMSVIGFTGLAALHSHDLMHFASLNE